MKTLAPWLLVVAVTLTGCAASIQRPEGQANAPALNIPAASAKRVVLNVQLAPAHSQDDGWKAFEKEWNDIARERVTAQGLDFETQDGAAKTQPAAGTLILVKVKDYRYVTVGSRMWAGSMTGNAYIDADVEFRDLRTGKVYGERAYNTSSSGWQGVFSAVTPKQIYALVDEMLVEIQRR